MSMAGARTRSECEELAKERGLIAFYPEPDELFMDYDIPYEVAVMKKGVAVFRTSPARVLKDTIHMDRWLWTKSVSGNAHLYLRIHTQLGYTERCLMQAILGSDLTREAFNFTRYLTNGAYKPGDEYVIALFETPEFAEEVIKWRETRKS